METPARPLSTPRTESDGPSVAVTVIGAGPAGATAARLLAQWGHDVVVITRPPPRPSLAESIPPSAGRLLDHLGWREIIDRAEFIRSTGNTFLWDGAAAPGGARMREARYPLGALGYQVDRGVLNRIMLEGTAQSGARIIDDATVTALQFNVVGYVRGTEENQVAARWVLDCSGRSGVVARLAWRRSVPRLRTLAIAAVWERDDAWPLADPTHTVVESHDRGWAWSIPVSASQRQVTLMVDPRLTKVGSHAALADAYRAELERVPGLLALTRGATLVGTPFARDASPYTAHQVAAPNVLLVGDAANFVDPLSSYGIKKALASAWLAAVVVHTALTDSEMLRPALAFYESRERAMYEALERQRAALAQAALAGDVTSEFWTLRAEADAELSGPNEDPDIDSLRNDPDVQQAFEELKRREGVAFVHGAGLERVSRPAIRDNRVVLEMRLRSPAFPLGIRYVRNIDLLTLLDIAPRATQVPDLYESYVREVGSVPLADFLGALSVLIGKRMLLFA